MESKNFIGIKDKDGKNLFERSKVLHKNREGYPRIYTVLWSENDKQWVGDCPDEIYDLSAELLAQSEYIPEKKLYYQLSDGGDCSGVIMELSGVMSWIEGDQDNCIEGEDMPEYTITPVWMTEDEFDNLPEAE